MAITLHERHPSFAAAVSGIDMRQPPTPEIVSEIEAAIDRFPVLVFPAQHINDEQQIAFTRAFGELQVSTAARTGREQRLNAEMTDASNIGADNRVLEAGDTIILMTGAHGFEVLEDVEMIEAKTGPYVPAEDKTRFAPVAPDLVKIDS